MSSGDRSMASDCEYVASTMSMAVSDEVSCNMKLDHLSCVTSKINNI